MRRTSIHVASLLFLFVPLAIAQTISHEKEREQWQNIGEIFKAMTIVSGSAVADVGAGDGFLTVRLSPLVGVNGHVYAEDILANRLDGLRKRAADAHLENIVCVLGTPDDPKLPSQLDAVVILNSYHEMPLHAEMLRHICQALKTGGRLVIAEPSPRPGEETRDQQVAKHHIASEFVAQEMAQAGLKILERRDDFARLPDGTGSYSIVVGEKTE